MTRERITVIIAALAVVGMLRSAWAHLVAEPRHDFIRKPIDPRYDPIRPYLPASGVLGYVSDERIATGAPGSDLDALGSRLFDEAQYALAPLLLQYPDRGAPLVLANLREPSRFSELLQATGLIVVAHPSPEVALLRRR